VRTYVLAVDLQDSGISAKCVRKRVFKNLGCARSGTEATDFAAWMEPEIVDARICRSFMMLVQTNIRPRRLYC
jgi:hypothetical protein